MSFVQIFIQMDQTWSILQTVSKKSLKRSTGKPENAICAKNIFELKN